MTINQSSQSIQHAGAPGRRPWAAVLLAALMLVLCAAQGLAQGVKPVKPVRRTTSPVMADTLKVEGDTLIVARDELEILPADSVTPAAAAAAKAKYRFMPNPKRAAWLSAICPGLGQLYNRRYWKLPIVVGAFVGLGYATSWNNSMLRDYTRAYADMMDNDPNTKSYMDFFPPNTQEQNLDKSWVTNVLKSRKNFYRRNRDLCIISMVGVYLLAMVDAYVDASLAHFDISPDLSMHLEPAVLSPPTPSRWPALGLCWAVTF